MSLEWDTILQGLHPVCSATVKSLGFIKPTPVQANVIPHFTKFKDVVVEACTGSGKTLSFLIPIYHMLLSLSSQLSSFECGALIITPTRELSDQIAGVAKTFLKLTNSIKIALITGGIRSHSSDIRVINDGCNIVIGTPGRILHVLSNHYLKINKLEVLVFDEADRLLEMGFEKQINKILYLLPKQRRTGLFSATQSQTNIQSLIRVGLRNPIHISLKITNKLLNTQSTPKTLSNQYIIINEGYELLYLLYLLQNISIKQKIIIFVLTCAQVDYLRCIIPKLIDMRDITHNILYIHGRLKQYIRSRVHRSFMTLNHGALICTDVVARGIDIPDIDLIIQFDPPQKLDFFIHRVGRTARMGKYGKAIVLLRKHETDYLQLLKIRKIPITQQIKINFKKRMFSKSKSKSKSNQSDIISFIESDIDDDSDNDIDIDIKEDEMNALICKLHSIVTSDRGILNKSIRAFVSFIEAYNNHECKYIFRISRLNCGLIANGMGLLYLPTIKRIKLNGIESFIQTNIDLNSIAFKRKDFERERQLKLKMIKQKKIERENKRKNKNKNKSYDNDNDNIKKHRKRKFKGNVQNKKRKARFRVNIQNEPSAKKVKRMEHKLREFRHYQREELLLRKLKRNQISQREFDDRMGYKL